MIDVHETDVLVLGAGGAGLCAALHAADASPHLRVAVVVKGLLGRAGCTRMVQGGYNAVLTDPDSLDAHRLDTLKGGGWINDQEIVWTLVTEAPKRVLELEWRYGCLFDRTREGRIHQKPFAGQTHDRTIHKGDLTGIEIMNRLSEQAAARGNVRAFEECRAVEFWIDDDGRAAGALCLDVRTGQFFAVRARATLLAMGGGPTMYRIIACSADKAADGIALAFAAGLPVRDMEMVQFHPTGLVIPGSLMTVALLEEGLRGAGGQLRNGRNERLMERYDPARTGRSTRDLVSRASFMEIHAGRGTPNAQAEQPAKPACSSLLLGAPTIRSARWDNVKQHAERPVYGGRIRKRGSDVGVEHYDVRSCPVSGDILAPHPTAEVIVRSHGVPVSRPSTRLLHTSFSLGGLPAAR